MANGVGFLSSGKPFSQKMLDLPANAMIKIVDIVTGKLVQLQVVTAEKIFPWLQYGPDWRRDGDVWPGVLCVTGDKKWAPGDVLLIVIDGKQFIFNRRSPMGTDGFKPYALAGEAFGHKDPDSAKSVITFGGEHFTVKKEGRWDVLPNLPGHGHIPSGDVARWLVAAAADETQAILAEDFRAGSDHDSVWSGYEILLDRTVKDVLTPDGE
jgi:hypothetical protein